MPWVGLPIARVHPTWFTGRSPTILGHVVTFGSVPSLKTGHAVAVLKLPQSVVKLVEFARVVKGSLAADPVTFPSPVPPLAQLEADTDALAAASVQARSGAPGAQPEVERTQRVLINDLHQVHAYVQLRATMDPAHAEAIITSAGLAVRKPAMRHKPALSAKLLSEGRVKLSARAGKDARAHEWQWGPDKVTWNVAPPTAQSTTTIENLPVGGILWFRHRTITRAGASDWSPAIYLAVM